ncbi:MAG: hypothetical protein RL557_356 [archaeon]|jgi:hypothetical protein
MPETEIIKDEKRKGSHFWLLVTLLFFGILFFLIYTSFYDVGFAKKFTGNVVTTTDALYDIRAELSAPDKLALNSPIKKISLKIKEPSQIAVGDQIMKLNKDANLIINNFEGTFTVDRKISLQGSFSQMFINGMPLQGKSGLVGIEGSDIEYNYIALEGVSIDQLSYDATGSISVNNGKIVVHLEKENFLIRKLQGTIEITKNVLKIRGTSADFRVEDFIKKAKAGNNTPA